MRWSIVSNCLLGLTMIGSTLGGVLPNDAVSQPEKRWPNMTPDEARYVLKLENYRANKGLREEDLAGFLEAAKQVAREFDPKILRGVSNSLFIHNGRQNKFPSEDMCYDAARTIYPI
ncbi:hypothetical protein F4779DRAFT_555663 [Xylariaceae sp. FL0662B]|nr:hypothetical protein F4779DRAFT_555663 [Xylariaceae sp. FL0662B]